MLRSSIICQRIDNHKHTFTVLWKKRFLLIRYWRNTIMISQMLHHCLRYIFLSFCLYWSHYFLEMVKCCFLLHTLSRLGELVETNNFYLPLFLSISLTYIVLSCSQYGNRCNGGLELAPKWYTRLFSVGILWSKEIEF